MSSNVNIVKPDPSRRFFGHASKNQEVWVDFDWTGADPAAGDFFRPFRTLADGVSAVAAHGVINIVPGVSAERGMLNSGKRLRDRHTIS